LTAETYAAAAPDDGDNEEDSVTSSIMAEDFHFHNSDSDEEDEWEAASPPDNSTTSNTRPISRLTTLRRHKKKSGPAPFTKSDIRAAAITRLHDLAQERCRGIKNNRPTSCRCLQAFTTHPSFADACVEYLMHWGDKKKIEQDQAVLSAYLSSQVAGELYKSTTGKTPRGLKLYQIPVSSVTHEPDIMQLTLANRICKDAFCAIHEIGRRRWNSIVQVATNSSVMKPHGGQGNQNSAMSPEKKEVLEKHFEELLGLATTEPRATRFIRDHLSGPATVRGDGDTVNDLFLPASNGYRPCYYRYCHDLGYRARNRGKQMQFQMRQLA
jgi:hypothetical protein